MLSILSVCLFQSQRPTLTLQPQQSPLPASHYNTMMIPQQSSTNVVQIATSLAQNSGPNTSAVATFAQDRAAQIRFASSSLHCHGYTESITQLPFLTSIISVSAPLQYSQFIWSNTGVSSVYVEIWTVVKLKTVFTHLLFLTLTGFLLALSCSLSLWQDKWHVGQLWCLQPCLWVKWWQHLLLSRVRPRPLTSPSNHHNSSSRYSSSSSSSSHRSQPCSQGRLHWLSSKHSFYR